MGGRSRKAADEVIREMLRSSADAAARRVVVGRRPRKSLKRQNKATDSFGDELNCADGPAGPS
jgi:hypothetical protein